MASTPADGAGEPVEAKGKGKEEGEKKKAGGGVLGRMWRGLFGGREDYEKRLQYLSKEEAAVHARMRRRTQFSRRTVRNIIVLSVIAEAVAVGYAIMMTRDEDLTWQMRAIRVLPMFVLPAIWSVVYSAVVNFTRMLERKDEKTLEKLRAERKAKIDELKERTNYYLTQQLIQKYDLDPAAKAAAASVLASKLGADSGLRVHLGEEPNSDAAVVMSNNAEILPSDGLRNRKQPNARGSRTGSTTAAHTSAQGAESSPALNAGLENVQLTRAVEHYQGSGAVMVDGLQKSLPYLLGRTRHSRTL
uniref:Lunapark domain-containing protein n=1 Tax=Triticum urartu TaxID=4572 RepID=A0A8R7UVI9_TRIUA